MAARIKLAKASKYKNRRTTVDGISFASAKEAKRYAELLLLKVQGKIRDLECQPRYPLVVANEVICTYVADFVYRDVATDRVIVEDCKGFRTPIYRLKIKLLHALRGITVVET